MTTPEPELAVRRLLTILVLCLTGAVGCASGDHGLNDTATNEDGDSPVSDINSLADGVPSNDLLPSEGKADANYPRQFDLIATQSPVRSQASRGVCSIFATIGLMEHLYIAGGVNPTPDFSEQYLQWSAKFEVGSYTNTEGSNADSNLEAISDFGIPEEGAWPYETTKWNTSNDPRCTGGEGNPTICYTNGEPPESARSAMKFRLPAGRWVNSTVQSLKGHMTEKNTAVVVGMDFFYQAWNHRASTLPVSQENWREGIVLFPNRDDITASHTHRAGHAIVLVGWDDDREAVQRDGMGNPVVDSSGNQVMERGFFLFKNSWGTASFGINNPHGPGYGWISFRYISQYASAYVSAAPGGMMPTREVCGNGTDDDRDGAADCADSDCAMAMECMSTPPGTYTNTTSVMIPDNSSRGAESEIVVRDTGNVRAVSVDVNIAHTYRGDLTVLLMHGTRTATLVRNQGGADDNIVQSFMVPDFMGADGSGSWKLVVRDNAAEDVGQITSWTLRLAR